MKAIGECACLNVCVWARTEKMSVCLHTAADPNIRYLGNSHWSLSVSLPSSLYICSLSLSLSPSLTPALPLTSSPPSPFAHHLLCLPLPLTLPASPLSALPSYVSHQFDHQAEITQCWIKNPVFFPCLPPLSVESVWRGSRFDSG